jgi:hypothetical protein
VTTSARIGSPPARGSERRGASPAMSANTVLRSRYRS